MTCISNGQARRVRFARYEMWLTMNGHTQHLQSGAIFELEPNVPHDELYGAEGAAYWVARKN